MATTPCRTHKAVDHQITIRYEMRRKEAGLKQRKRQKEAEMTSLCSCVSMMFCSPDDGGALILMHEYVWLKQTKPEPVEQGSHHLNLQPRGPKKAFPMWCTLAWRSNPFHQLLSIAMNSAFQAGEKQAEYRLTWMLGRFKYSTSMAIFQH